MNLSSFLSIPVNLTSLKKNVLNIDYTQKIDITYTQVVDSGYKRIYFFAPDDGYCIFHNRPPAGTFPFLGIYLIDEEDKVHVLKTMEIPANGNSTPLYSINFYINRGFKYEILRSNLTYTDVGIYYYPFKNIS